MNLYKLLLICNFILLSLFQLLKAQDLGKLTSSDPVIASGSVQFSDMLYFSNRKPPSRHLQTYIFNGNINFNFFGIMNAPFTFNYSNLGTRFSQPNFNQSSFHPSYKWVTLHIGTLAQSWNAYTVNGHVFNGVAIDINPGNWNFSFLHGRFQKAVQPDTTAGSMATATFKRMGTGFKLGYNHAKINIGMQYFHAKDDKYSISIPAYSGITPAQNECIGLQTQFQVFRKVRIKNEMGMSKLNNDLRVTHFTSQHFAMKHSLIYTVPGGQIALNYEKVDPGYRTMGAYYFNNDLENITAGLQLQFLKNKISIAGNIGRQHDNLDRRKRSELTRTVCNANLNLNIFKKLTFSANYSNFLSFTNVRPFTDYQNGNNPYIGWDTLNFRQIVENIQTGILWNIQKDSVRILTFNLNGTSQRSADQLGENPSPSNVFYNLNSAIAFAKIKSGSTISCAFNAGQIENMGFQIQNYYAGLNLSQTLFRKKLQLAISCGNTASYLGTKNTGSTDNLRGVYEVYAQKKAQFFD